MDTVERYAALSVPRYTSYPTAADFDAAVGPRDHARWLRDLDPREAVSAYVHVPYCQQICHYCGCHAKMARRDTVIDAYRDRLAEEIRLVAGLCAGRIPIGRLAWGGGTPSILGAEGLVRIVDTLARHFDTSDIREHSIELDPRQLSPELCRRLVDIGVDRASLGVQDTNPVVQQAIGREQPMDVVRAAVGTLRDAGIARINIDLIYGLPEQTERSIADTCDAVAAMRPDRIACYGYAHLPHRRANQRLIDPQRLPGPVLRMALAEAVRDSLISHGYERVGIDHYALADDPLAQAMRGGRLHRNFQGYTDDEGNSLIGFGASAISQLPGGFVQNEPAIGAYSRMVTEGRLATRRGHELSDDDRRRASIIEALMCNLQIDLGTDGGRFADEVALLRPYVADGLVRVAGTRIEMTEIGRPFVRLAAAVFDRYRTESGMRFSGAV
ncbi:oxygen-independent coproporphyrinogen III oxidase [Aureimonas altamirensis]|uniref:oxygen-independent coproporphyrinogen III oxidase n=1 Tax=Aureimonas altamirensis TaxID=370622 RepID=UPI002037472D|nr:oxygen-independent coproporphyrinogen III oxidase [Aureimonas altamirensis]MCM2503946.1 oxygen-independent coproporphyrinogen III oxidase [Aureimonas altamirensis]